MRINTTSIVFLVVVFAAPVHAWLPLKCVNDKGQVAYSDSRSCPAGYRVRIGNGTFSTSTNQTIQVIDQVIPGIMVSREPAVAKDPKQRAPITSTIPQ